jgi:LacI family transcriptional regulator
MAILNLSPTVEARKWPLYYREVTTGVRERAARLGFSTEIFHLFERGMTAARLEMILHNRGINGVIVPPFVGTLQQLPLTLERLSTVLIGYSISQPLHRASPDQFQAMMLAMERMAALGYRRIGLVLDDFTDRRVGHKWVAAHAWHERKYGPCPQLSGETITNHDLVRWIEKEQPQAILSPRPEHLQAIRSAGIRVPDDLGFCLLNYADHLEPCTGIDQRANELGAAAVDTLVAQLYRNERGIPPVPTTVYIEARWIEGPTTRPHS